MGVYMVAGYWGRVLRKAAAETLAWAKEHAKATFGGSVLVFLISAVITVDVGGAEKAWDLILAVLIGFAAVGVGAMVMFAVNVVRVPAAMQREREAELVKELDDSARQIAEQQRTLLVTNSADRRLIHDEIGRLLAATELACENVKTRIFADTYGPFSKAIHELKVYFETKRQRLAPPVLEAVETFYAIAGHVSYRFNQFGLEIRPAHEGAARRERRQTRYCYQLARRVVDARARALAAMAAAEAGQSPKEDTYRRLVVRASETEEPFRLQYGPHETAYTPIAQVAVENVSPQPVTQIEVALVAGEPPQFFSVPQLLPRTLQPDPWASLAAATQGGMVQLAPFEAITFWVAKRPTDPTSSERSYRLCCAKPLDGPALPLRETRDVGEGPPEIAYTLTIRVLGANTMPEERRFVLTCDRDDMLIFDDELPWKP